MRNKFIPVYDPWLTSLEREYAYKAIESTWISSNGEYIQKAEKLFAEFIGLPKAIVTSNGTTALHLCCRVAGVRAGDVVLVPSTTYAATAFAPAYCGAKVRFVDSDPETWNIDLSEVERICKESQVDHVIPVHLFGNPVDMKALQALSATYGFTVIEDACESIGASIENQSTGKFSKVAAFSFYGNKTFTCGEGGALTSTHSDLVDRAQMLRGQAQSFDKRYWHIDIGYNYRMTNIQAAILCAQLERREQILAAKLCVATNYMDMFKRDSRIKTQKVLSGHKHGYWMIVIETPLKTIQMAAELARFGIDSRPMFYPLNEMPPFDNKDATPVSKRLSEHCIMLPSSPTLEHEDIEYICGVVSKILDASSKTNNSRSI